METTQTANRRVVVSSQPPRWAFWAAYAVPLCLLPSSVWRAHLATTEDGWYALLLSGLEMGLGLLTLGLVHAWGEVTPRWMPLLGGRRIPVHAAVIPATFGAIAVSLICAYGALNWAFDLVSPGSVEEARSLSAFDVPEDADLELPGGWVAAAYAPLLAWGPLLAAVTCSYYRRRTRSEREYDQQPGRGVESPSAGSGA